MNFRLLAMLFAVSALVFTACDDDGDSMFSSVNVTAPSGVQAVNNGETGLSMTFDVSFDSELTASYEAVGSGVTVTNPNGDVTGSSITINYDAGTTGGAASITVTVTDSEGDSDEATAVINIAEDPNTIILRENITEDATWTSDKTWVLGGRITVEAGATLTIQPGTVIKGEAGTGANATALLIARNATLLAEGTANAPIIFTSVADEITPERVASGDFTSPNLDPDINGLWGGVIVLGNATISASNDNDDDVSEVQIEGIPATDTNGLYGGTDDSDNSGVISHISIRHGGSNIGAGNEINGLTLGGVGSSTIINNVEVVANQDDGIEWFGGTVSVDDVVVWNAGDDAIDTDQSWGGTLDNFFVVTPVGSCFELDGPEGSYVARQTIQNGTIVPGLFETNDDGELELVAGATGLLIDTDTNTPLDMSNVHFVGPFVDGQDVTDDELDNTTFNNITFDVDPANLVDLMEAGMVPAGISAGGSPVADKSNLGWTWAAQVGGLDGL
ncbi:MAG: hypothetical protein ACE362_10200 [Phaeodactylibacter xiamenensis]|uniref:Uncharacterized protein n=1 Tax=Phaeodactylibacter xiamenensis TaxID=1524460 RepID=A0A098S4T6_9BACT|nr:hypothetical protein [Phaeodactylibacter xiamenensis]KGE87071.1 hypothetical protein IX84_18860 [Phaeodactylibacter xiamenensis]MCR9050761.1 hypothetical protein [bacterium]